MSYPIWRILLVLAFVGLVGGGIASLIKAAKKKGGSVGSIPPSDTTSPASTRSYGGTSKIFINGGAPSSGNTLGKISVDGKSMSVYYSDVPLEITIPTGNHHIVVEGGVYGDARIDRFIDFDSLDVWTVDLPGRNDADVIRHQMISYSEYRSALSSSGFSVTRKEL